MAAILLFTIPNTVLLALLVCSTVDEIYNNDGDLAIVPISIALVVEVLLLMLGVGLSIFRRADFGKYAYYVFVIPYVVLGVASLISLLVLWVVRYARKEREALTTPDYEAIRTAVKAGRVREVMRLYKVQKALANWPIKEAIYEATSELRALQRDSSTELVSIGTLTEESENVLNTIWIFTDRIVAVRRQGIDSPRIRNALYLQEQRIRSLTKVVHEIREDLAEWTLNGWEGQEIEKAQEKLRDLASGLREYMDDNAFV